MKRIVIFFVIALLGLVMFYLFSEQKETGTLSLSGHVDIRSVNASFRVGGRLATLCVDEGSPVRRGELLGKLDAEPFEIALRQANAELAVQKAISENAEKEFRRYEILIRTNAVSRQLFETAEKNLKSARAAVQLAEAKLAQANLNLRDTELRAPEDGILMTRVAEPGTLLSAGSPVFSISLRSPVWVRAYVDEVFLDKVHLNQKVRIITDGGKTFAGTICFISPEAEFTPKTVETADIRTTLVYRLRIVVDSPCEQLNHGAPVRVYPEN